MYLLKRETLTITGSTALLVGAANIDVILLICTVAFSHVHTSNFRAVHIPFLAGEPFQPALLQTIFGVVLLAYGGHSAVANCGRTGVRPACVLAHRRGGSILIDRPATAHT